MLRPTDIFLSAAIRWPGTHCAARNRHFLLRNDSFGPLNGETG
jgi:hypothetical protein